MYLLILLLTIIIIILFNFSSFYWYVGTKAKRPITGQQSKHKKNISSDKSQTKTHKKVKKTITRGIIVKAENVNKLIYS
jgi:LAS superfamily LD-carboxypeptidase LdcB